MLAVPRRPAMIGTSDHGVAARFSPWAVDAWRERTDAILTALGPVNRPVSR
jgi:hypothetical protein